MKYSGIGSRETPKDILEQMITIGRDLAEKGWILRSGGADGADSAFEQGCDEVHGAKQIFLPWKGFNKNSSQYWKIPPEAFDLAAGLHPNWSACSDAARKLHARNCQQILGPALNDPVDLVICWTKSGGEFGGTATAMKLARQNGIRVVNLFSEKWNGI